MMKAADEKRIVFIFEPIHLFSNRILRLLNDKSKTLCFLEESNSKDHQGLNSLQNYEYCGHQLSLSVLKASKKKQKKTKKTKKQKTNKTFRISQIDLSQTWHDADENEACHEVCIEIGLG